MKLSTYPASGEQPVPKTKAVPTRVYVELALIVFFWALNWPFMKYAVQHSVAMDFIVLRLGGAAVVMMLVALVTKQPLMPERGERLAMAWVGVWQVGMMLGPSVLGLQYVGPGRAAVFVYTMPLWALPLGWLIAKDKVSRMSVIGSLIGFCGLMLYMNPRLVNWHDPKVVLGNALVMSAGLGWAIGASLYRRRKWKSSSWTQTTWQILWSSIAVLPFLLTVKEHHVEWSATYLGVLAFNWVIPTALCYWWWSRTLTEIPASRAGQIVSIVPVLALIMASVWNGEPLTPVVWVCMALITAGIVVTVRGRSGEKPELVCAPEA